MGYSHSSPWGRKAGSKQEGASVDEQNKHVQREFRRNFGENVTIHRMQITIKRVRVYSLE